MSSVTLEDVLRCSRCDKIMSTPTTLGCFHSFCQSCKSTLESNIQQDIYGNMGVACPLCKYFTKQNDIVTKFVLSKCVEAYNYKTKLDTGEFNCMQCECAQIESKCLHCNKELCKNCAITHLSIPQCKDHKVVSISDAPLETVTNMPVFCRKHSGQEIVLHCIQCQKPICQVCKVQSHDTHHSESTEVAVKKLLPEIRQKLTNYQRRIKQLNTSISGFDMESKKLDKNVDVIKKQLEERKQRTIAKIVADYDSLCGRIDEEANHVAADIQSRKLWAKLELAHHESIVSWVNNITNLIKGSCLLMEIHSSMMSSVTTHDKKLPMEKLNVQLPFLSFSPGTKLGRNENSLGELSYSNTPQQALVNNRKPEFQSREFLSKSHTPNQMFRDIPSTTPTPKSSSIADIYESREYTNHSTKLEVIQDDEEELLGVSEEEKGLMSDRSRDDSPTSVASMPIGQERNRQMKPGGKQVSFVRTLITPLPEDEEIPADGRVSRASERLSRASVNIPLVSNQSNRSKGTYGRLSVNSVPQELGWSKRNRSSDRSPARSVQDDPSRPDMYPSPNERSFRCIISSKFSDLTSIICKPTGEFKIKNFHNRMCIIDDEIWMPVTEENGVAIYSTAGSLLKECLSIQNIERPHALHPLNPDHILIAAENGLFVLFANSMNVSQLLKGNFSDVCVDKTLAVALECKNGKIYVLDFKEKPVQKISFRTNINLVNMYKNESKLVLCDNYIYVSVYNDDPILKYDIHGKQIGEYGKWGKGAAGNMGSPKVCAVDNKGNVLVSDFANNRIQIMTSTGKWAVLLTHVKNPKDAVVLDGGLLYILTDDHKIIMFRAEKATQ